MGVCVVGVVGWGDGDWVEEVVSGGLFGERVDCVVGLVLGGVEEELVEGFRMRVFRGLKVFPHVVRVGEFGGGVGYGVLAGLLRELVVLSGGRGIVVVLEGGGGLGWLVSLAFLLAASGVRVGVYFAGLGWGVEPGVVGELGRGVSGFDARVLRVVAEFPGLDSGEVAERLGVSAKTVSNRLWELRSRGLVYRRRGRYYLSERGFLVLFLRGLPALHSGLREGLALALEERPYDPRGTEGCLEEGCDGED